LFNKEKQRPFKKAKNTKKIFSTSHQQAMYSHFLGSRALVRVAVASENKWLNNEESSTPSFS